MLRIIRESSATWVPHVHMQPEHVGDGRACPSHRSRMPLRAAGIMDIPPWMEEIPWGFVLSRCTLLIMQELLRNTGKWVEFILFCFSLLLYCKNHWISFKKTYKKMMKNLLGPIFSQYVFFPSVNTYITSTTRVKNKSRAYPFQKLQIL